MKILILEDGYIAESHEKPIPGRRYILEDAEEHTDAQRKAAHALINEWYKSGAWDYDTTEYNVFRDYVKKDYGAGFSHYEYVDDKYCMHRVASVDDVPDYVLDDFNGGNRGRIKGVLKSFTRYKKKEVQGLIDKLLDVMISRGVNSAKFQDIVLSLGE